METGFQSFHLTVQSTDKGHSLVPSQVTLPGIHTLYVTHVTVRDRHTLYLGLTQYWYEQYRQKGNGSAHRSIPPSRKNVKRL